MFKKLGLIILLICSSQSLLAQLQLPDELDGQMQSRYNLGIGGVSAGMGIYPAGNYEVTLYINSHQRFAVYADDGGHEEWYCDEPDLSCTSSPPSYCKYFAQIGSFCGQHWYIDGVKLVEGSKSTTGLSPQSFIVYEVQGSLDVEGSQFKWEWPSEGSYDHAGLSLNETIPYRLTKRSRRLATIKYRINNWSGQKYTGRAKVQWKELDPGPIFTADDKAEWATFNTGDMVTRCLQTGIALPQSENYYWHLCSEDGYCNQNLSSVGSGGSGLHYNIANYYNVSCSVSPVVTNPPDDDFPPKCIGFFCFE